MKKLLCLSLMLLCITLLAGCGGTAAAPKVDRSIKAVIKPTALTADRNIAGIILSISLPVGVTPPLAADGSINTAATVDITSSAPQNQILPGATYTPATATASGQLAISAIAAAGFQLTDQITLYLKVAEGAFPVESDFRLLSFEAFDTNGAPITGLNPTLTTTIQ